MATVVRRTGTHRHPLGRALGRLRLRLIALLGAILVLVVQDAVLIDRLDPDWHPWYAFALSAGLAGILGCALVAFAFTGTRALRDDGRRASARTQRLRSRLVALRHTSTLLSGAHTARAPRDVVRQITSLVHADRGEWLDATAAATPAAASTAPRHRVDVPLRYGAGRLGTIRLEREAARPPFSSIEIEMATAYATYAEGVLRNGQLVEQVRAIAIENERRRLAHEMHDGLAQVLSFVSTKGQAADLYLRRGDYVSAGTQLDELVSAVRHLSSDVREEISALRATVDSDQDLVGALRAYLDEVSGRTTIPLQLSVEAGLRRVRLEPAVTLHVLRIVQEAVGNVIRHAQATLAVVAVVADTDAVVVVVSDDGVGFCPDTPTDGANPPRFGLRTIRERAEAIGATLKIVSSVGHGTVLVLRLPSALARGPQCVSP